MFKIKKLERYLDKFSLHYFSELFYNSPRKCYNQLNQAFDKEQVKAQAKY